MSRIEPRRQSVARPTRIRKRSTIRVFGLPLWEIARGADPKHGEDRGHARAIIAVGDVADGIVAVGGIARGGVTIGGISLGILSLGGVSVSLLAAVGGVAIAPLAYGGAAVGAVAIGGAALGCYAKGDKADGLHVVSRVRKDPKAVAFFRKWLPRG
jgi:hypothetical protein